MMKNFILIVLFFYFFISINIYSQSIEINDIITWKGLIKETSESGAVSEYLSFKGAFTDTETNLPQYSHSTAVPGLNSKIEAEFTGQVFQLCTGDESDYLSHICFNQTTIELNTSISVGRKIPQSVISFIPIRKNSMTGAFEKLISFGLKISITDSHGNQKEVIRDYADNSVLNEGEWYKIKVDQSGIYKIGYSDLQSYGINPGSIDPRNIKLYGNAMGMLPEKNSISRYDDLQENAIIVNGEEDGKFDQQDFILFYGMSPHLWQNTLGFFTYIVNLYDDYNYYYLTTSPGEGKRLEFESSSLATPTHNVTDYNDYKVFEEEKINLILSGKKWYGDIFGEILSREYPFHFPNINTDKQVIIKTEIANRTFINESMTLSVNNETYDTLVLTSVLPTSTKYAQKKKKTIVYNPSGPDINIQLEYFPATASSIAWLDYIMVNAYSHLNFNNDQLLFRNLSTVMDGAVSKFMISNTLTDVMVWDISDPILPKKLETMLSSNQLTFTVPTETLREFIVFDPSHSFIPEFVELVGNQNLHGEGPFDMIIVTHPLFMNEAYQLAGIHEAKDGFAIKVVTPAEIYNEFSSGKQDPTAIRDYLKMLYDRYYGNEPRFLTLFGDGSFDPKNRIVNNSNLIPTFQTEESWLTSSSYVIDDYFGYLDDNEGNDGQGELDIGIGRLPVQTAEEAQLMISKIQDYISTGSPAFGPWRTKICMIADDEDGNLHLDQADSLTNWSGFIPKDYNVQKIYLDAYTQLKTPSGYLYPDVNIAINKAVNEGALIINYVGHGGKAGWAHERILQSNDIIGWKNMNRLPVFITATCEFSRFDEPEFKTGGELVLLNPEGGGIALFTTTRLAYAQSNFTLNQRVYTTAFTVIDGQYPYLGDIIRRSKPPGQLTTRNFVLLGDPALKLAYPEYGVRTIQLSNHQTNQATDTIRALDFIKITGDITDRNGNTIVDFNGYAEVKIYDKKTIYKTKGNDQYSYPTEFFCQDKIIWQGTVTVADGKFECSFIVPKDIAYNFGKGKISYYAWSETSDAIGHKNDVIIGGINDNASPDMAGPDIDLYLNNLSFVSGDQTHKNPVLLAFLSDESGINLSLGGIGHDITLVLDNDQTNVISLNDYFIQDLDSFKSGEINYPFYNLPDGNHTLTLKAWDNYNNSGEKTITFVINTHGPLELSKVMNYPNPFRNSTTFTFNHTRPGDDLKIELKVFDMNGKIVQSYENTFNTENTETPFLIWNGDDLKGNKLKNGVYPYTLQITDEDGNISIQRQKLVLMSD